MPRLIWIRMILSTTCSTLRISAPDNNVMPKGNAEDDMGWSGGRGAHNLTTDDDD